MKDALIISLVGWLKGKGFTVVYEKSLDEERPFVRIERKGTETAYDSEVTIKKITIDVRVTAGDSKTASRIGQQLTTWFQEMKGSDLLILGGGLITVEQPDISNLESIPGDTVGFECSGSPVFVCEFRR